MSKEPKNVIPMQSPAPLKHEHPFGTPNPEDALIDMIDRVSPPRRKRKRVKLKALK